MTIVAFQGERGAFSEDAVAKLFGETDLLPCRTLGEVFEAVQAQAARFGVVPLENSQAGSINETYDLLLRYPLNVYGEVVLAVNHCLMALPGDTLDSIIRVFSHPQALAQCDAFLRRLKAELVPAYDTAGSAKMIKEQGLRQSAAIASERAARLYGLDVLARNIQTNPNNYTKFAVISREKASRAARNKTSLVFATKNIPGALYSCLGAFATRDLNLTKLESRPSKDRPWDYVFYVDFEGHSDDPVCHEAIEDLRTKTTFLKILGSYPATT